MIIHHTQLLPISAYGKAPTKFLLVHLKNLNKYQRIKSNMQKLTALHFVKHDTDFSNLLKINLNTINDVNLNTLHDNNARRYIVETRKLIEHLHADKKYADDYGVIELCNKGKIKFYPTSYEKIFNKIMNSNYFDLINFDPNITYKNRYTPIARILKS
jgi:hypothetical protein